MEIVIKISEEDYNNIEPFLNGQTIKGGFNLFKVLEMVKNGTPLPKGHGRLIDADKLELDDGYSNYDGYYHKYSQSQIHNAPTVLEAEVKDNGVSNNW